MYLVVSELKSEDYDLNAGKLISIERRVVYATRNEAEESAKWLKTFPDILSVKLYRIIQLPIKD